MIGVTLEQIIPQFSARGRGRGKWVFKVCYPQFSARRRGRGKWLFKVCYCFSAPTRSQLSAIPQARHSAHLSWNITWTNHISKFTLVMLTSTKRPFYPVSLGRERPTFSPTTTIIIIKPWDHLFQWGINALGSNSHLLILMDCKSASLCKLYSMQRNVFSAYPWVKSAHLCKKPRETMRYRSAILITFSRKYIPSEAWEPHKTALAISVQRKWNLCH